MSTFAVQKHSKNRYVPYFKSLPLLLTRAPTALASEALGDDLDLRSTTLNRGAELGEGTFWSNTFSDLRQGNYVVYTPNTSVTPIVTYGDYTTATSTVSAAAKRLEEQGLVYPCFCTRKELLAASAPHASAGARVYDGRCRRLSPQEKAALWASGRSPAWRVQVPAETVSFVDGNYGPQAQRLDRDCGDFILRRSDGVYAYQLAVAADDGAMGITRVVRGWDLLSSTPRQIWLLEQLGYPVPAYCHVPLLLAPDGRRLSKRDRDLDVGYLQAHSTPEKVTGLLAWLAGLQPRPEPVQPRELIGDFAWTKVGAQDKVVDEAAWQAL